MATGHKATGSNKRSKPKRRVIRSDPPSKEGVDRMDLPPARGCPRSACRPPRASCVSSLSPPSWSSSFRGAYFGIRDQKDLMSMTVVAVVFGRLGRLSPPPLFGSISPIDVQLRGERRWVIREYIYGARSHPHPPCLLVDLFFYHSLSSLSFPSPITYTLKVTEQNRSTSRRCDFPASPSSPRPSRR